MPLDLTPEDVEVIKGLLDQGEPLPDRFRASLFAGASAAELIWPGKTTRVETAVLPFQSIEHVDEPRQETSSIPSLFDMDPGSGRQVGGWTNKLIWGDNRLILSSLANGPMRKQIEDAGGLKFVYIDPPFDVGADFSMDVEVGGETVTKKPSVIEEVAYRDTWGKGAESYLSMISERLHLIRSLMHDEGLIVVHIDWRVDAQVRLVMDEVFGSDNFVNQLVWAYRSGGASRKASLPRKHDNLLLFRKTKSATVAGQTERQYLDKPFMGSKQDTEGRYYVDTILRDVIEGALPIVAEDGEIRVFNTRPVLNLSTERVGYPTQKPEGLISLLLNICSEPGDLVADFFCGSGTLPVVAEREGRKWLANDLSRFSIHTTRKRLIDVQRGQKAAGLLYRAFEVLNLGQYERQHFVGVDVNLSSEERSEQARQREEAYLTLILKAYAGERAKGTPPFHGVKGTTAVLVGPIDAPVTEKQVREAIAAAVSARVTRIDVLGFEFEMGLKPLLQDEAREQGVNLALRYIPNDVFDTRAVKSGDVKFHEVAYVEFRPSVSGGEVTVALEDFAVFYRQEDAESAAAGLRNGSSRVVVDDGQVVKVSKDRSGIITRDVLTSKWTDWIDYWAVDFDYMSQPEVIRVVEDGEEKQVKTGRFIFENRWQSFRTKQDRELELASAPFEYPEPGTYKVAVKVIDIFGNDTTRVVAVRVRS